MKKKGLLLKLFPMAVAGLLITSCSNDESITTNETDIVALKPAKASEFSVYSGGINLTSAGVSRAVASNIGSFIYTKYHDASVLPVAYRNNMPEKIQDKEKNTVLDYIKNHPNEASTAFYNINYFVQYVGGSYKNYSGDTMKDQNGAQHDVTGSQHMDYIEIYGNHINDYNAGYGPDALCQNLPLMNPAYHDSYGDKDNTKYNSYKIYKINYQANKIGYYLCFDYKTSKNSGEHYDGDGVYDDYIIKLTPADDTTYGNDEVPSEPSDPTEPTEPSVTPTNEGNGEVEVNLSVNAEKSVGDYIATKLSIHVRDTTDVEVFIPVPAEYYCQADDMNIVLSHKNNDEIYNNTQNYASMDYSIAGQTVTLKVTYELEGIRATTSGINSTVLKYLRQTYGDGVTFEIWNYFKDTFALNGTSTDVTRGMLKNQFLDKSTVRFTSNIGRYINAFGTIANYQGKVYCKTDENGIRTPFKDEALTVQLDQDYWYRSETDTRYYMLYSTVNDWDCKVIPSDDNYVLNAEKGYNKIYKR